MVRTAYKNTQELVGLRFRFYPIQCTCFGYFYLIMVDYVYKYDGFVGVVLQGWVLSFCGT